jgi:hypothetical protein
MSGNAQPVNMKQYLRSVPHNGYSYMIKLYYPKHKIPKYTFKPVQGINSYFLPNEASQGRRKKRRNIFRDGPQEVHHQRNNTY